MQVHACMLCTFFNVLPYWIITHVSLSVSVSFWFPHIFAVPGFRSFSEFWFFSPVFWSLFFRFIFSNPGFFRFRFSVFQFCSYFSVFEFLFLFFRFLIFCFSVFRFPACMFFRVFVRTGKSHETDAETALWSMEGFHTKAENRQTTGIKWRHSTSCRPSGTGISWKTCHNEAAQPSVAEHFSKTHPPVGR